MSLTSRAVYVSRDDGETWNRTSGQPGSTEIVAMLVRGNGDRVAGTFGGGVFVSTDGGASWARSTVAPLPGGLKSVVTGPGNLLFAGSNAGGSANGVYVSTDAGVSWTKNVTGLATTTVQSLVYDRDRDMLYAGTYGGGVYISSDRGATWDSAGSSNPYVMAITVARSTGEVFIAGGFGGGKVYRSSDMGQSWMLDSVPTWRNVVALAHNDVRGVLYAGTFLDGVFRLSTASSGIWEKINDGLPNLQVEALEVDELTGTVYAGVRGDGVVAGLPRRPACSPEPERTSGSPSPIRVS
jgi:photosystem II stability/assembly factor-like uncharacterized protein